MQAHPQKTIAHDDVTHGAVAHKILKKIIDLAMRIELTLSILMPWSWNSMSNLTIHFHICSYSATFFAHGHGFDAVTVAIS